MKIRNNIELMATPTEGSHVANVDYVDGKMKTITWVEYEALTEEEKNNGTLYDIPDMPTAAGQDDVLLTSDVVTELDDAATDEQIPSAKAVYDAIKEKTNEVVLSDDTGFKYVISLDENMNVKGFPSNYTVYTLNIPTDNVNVIFYTMHAVHNNRVEGDAILDYGDGTIETIPEIKSVTHKYQTAGTYKVRLKNAYVYYTSTTDYGGQYVSEVLAGKNITGAYLYNGCTNITNIDTSTINKLRSCYNMFYGCTGLTSLDASNLDVSNVTSLSNTFVRCTGLTSLDVSSWDTSNVVSMNTTFGNCTGLTSLDISNWNTGNVTDMNNMFSNCTGLTSLDISNWNTSKVAGFASTFFNCKKLTSLDVSKWNVSKASNFSNTFSGCTGLTSLDVSNWNTSSAKYFTNTFNGCTGLTSLDFSNWNTSNVTNTNNMFLNCSALTILKLGNNFIVTNITTYEDMFTGCTALTKIQIPADFPAESKTFLEARLTDAGILANVTFETY